MMALFTFLVILYTVLVMLAIIGWKRLPATILPPGYLPKTTISVLIPVRNEAEKIADLLADLEKQNYSKSLFEVIIADDHSEDGTMEIVWKFSANSDLDLKLVSLKNGMAKGKKSAIQLGLKHAAGSLIVQTDGDCRVQPDWLRLIAYCYETNGAKFISGPVCLEANRSFFGKMQVVEFASLIGTGAAAIGADKPNMCNGANLAYEKEAFFLVGGFSGNENLASGDDEFLMHKIQKEFPGQVQFLKNFKAIVFTPAAASVGAFFSQRIRWASKWRFYKNISAQVVALVVFGANAALLIGLGFWLTGNLSGENFWVLFLAKSGIDFVFLALVLRFFGRTRYLFYLLPLQLVYAPYVVICALAGLTGTYRWKGRIVKNP